jgi:hypothetical protein
VLAVGVPAHRASVATGPGWSGPPGVPDLAAGGRT